MREAEPPQEECVRSHSSVGRRHALVPAHRVRAALVRAPPAPCLLASVRVFATCCRSSTRTWIRWRTSFPQLSALSQIWTTRWPGRFQKSPLGVCPLAGAVRS